MGVCGSSSITKGEKSRKNQNKNQIKISVIYNDEPKKDYLINKNEKLSSILKELGINEDADYDFYDSNNMLINDKINEEIVKIFNIKQEILILIKQAYIKLDKDNRKYIVDNTSLIGTLIFDDNSSLGIFIYHCKTKQILSRDFSFEKY